jgi:DNA-binding Xre family transcriptional regulator
MELHKLMTSDLKKMSLSQLVDLCKSLDNNNGDWIDIKQSEYEDIFEIAWDLIAEYQSDYYN